MDWNLSRIPELARELGVSENTVCAAIFLNNKRGERGWVDTEVVAERMSEAGVVWPSDLIRLWIEQAVREGLAQKRFGADGEEYYRAGERLPHSERPSGSQTPTHAPARPMAGDH